MFGSLLSSMGKPLDIYYVVYLWKYMYVMSFRDFFVQLEIGDVVMLLTSTVCARTVWGGRDTLLPVLASRRAHNVARASHFTS